MVNFEPWQGLFSEIRLLDGEVTRAYFRPKTRRFASFPTTTYSNRIHCDVNVRITYDELSGHALNFKYTKHPLNLPDMSPYVTGKHTPV